MNDEKKSELTMWAIVLVIGLALVVAGLYFVPPMLADVVTQLEPGVGIKTAAIWSFGVTIGVFVLFAVVAGDGIIGEIQFMLGGFFLFFIIITLLIAWVF